MVSAAERGGMADPGRGLPAGTLAILAGGGVVPVRVAHAAQAAGRSVFVVALRGHASAELEAFPHVWLGLGQVGAFFAELDRRGCGELVIVGHVARPELKDIRFDFGGIARLPRIAVMMRGGDDRLLVHLIRLVEERGVRVVAPQEVAPELVLAPGAATRRKPSRKHAADIALGRQVIAALGPYDVGQGVVVDNGRVIAVEAAEGTDAMLARCADLRAARRGGPSGVLVKAPKPGQETRVDLPTIGDRTVDGAARAGLAGIAAAAGRTLVADATALRAAAGRHGLFVFGFEEGDGEAHDR